MSYLITKLVIPHAAMYPSKRATVHVLVG